MDTVKLTKGESVKMVSNHELIEKLITDGWTVEEQTEQPKTEQEAAPAKRGRPKKA